MQPSSTSPKMIVKMPGRTKNLSQNRHSQNTIANYKRSEYDSEEQGNFGAYSNIITGDSRVEDNTLDEFMH